MQYFYLFTFEFLKIICESLKKTKKKFPFLLIYLLCFCVGYVGCKERIAVDRIMEEVKEGEAVVLPEKGMVIVVNELTVEAML